MIGIGIVSFDRPHYLGQLLASLEGQYQPPEMDVHLWQDGAVNRYSGRVVGDQGRIETSRQCFVRARLPGFKTAHVHDDNVGIGINQFEAYEWMCQYYERVVILENDIVLSPYWARLLPILFEGLAEHPDTFGFTTDFKRRVERHEIEDNLSRVVYEHPHWWMIAFTPDRWARIRPGFLRYYELIRECDYNAIPHERIRALFDEVQHPVRTVTSQDGGKDMAVRLNGMHRATLAVNRGISIGREGIHFNPVEHRRLGYDDQEPYIFESDATRDHFDWPEDQ